MSNTKRYEPLLEAAEEEKSAAGKCRWIIEVLRLLCTNDMPHLCTDMRALTQEVRKRNNRVMVLLGIVLVVVVVTNPQVAKIAAAVFEFIF